MPCNVDEKEEAVTLPQLEPLVAVTEHAARVPAGVSNAAQAFAVNPVAEVEPFPVKIRGTSSDFDPDTIKK